MASHNDITGDALVSKRSNDNYRDNYDRIFGKKKKENDNAGTNADGSAVSVSSVSGTGSAGACGELRDNDTEGSAE